MTKRKLTLSIDENIINLSKKLAAEKGVTLSRIVTNALKFFIDPNVYCFSCGKKFRIKTSSICTKCGWYICPSCGSCACSLREEGARVAYYMRKTLMEVFLSQDI